MKTISSSFFCFLFLCLLQYSSSQGGCCCFSEWKSDAKILPSDKWKENRNFPWYEEVTHVTMYYSLDQVSTRIDFFNEFNQSISRYYEIEKLLIVYFEKKKSTRTKCISFLKNKYEERSLVVQCKFKSVY